MNTAIQFRRPRWPTGRGLLDTQITLPACEWMKGECFLDFFSLSQTLSDQKKLECVPHVPATGSSHASSPAT